MSRKGSDDSAAGCLIAILIGVALVGSSLFVLLPLVWLVFEFLAFGNRRPEDGFQLTEDEYEQARTALAFETCSSLMLDMVHSKADHEGLKTRGDGKWDERNKAAKSLNREKAEYERNIENAQWSFYVATLGPGLRFDEWKYHVSGAWGGRFLVFAWFFVVLLAPEQSLAHLEAFPQMFDDGLNSFIEFGVASLVPVGIGLFAFWAGYAIRSIQAQEHKPPAPDWLVDEYEETFGPGPYEREAQDRLHELVAKVLPDREHYPHEADEVMSVAMAVLLRYMVEADGHISELEKVALAALRDKMQGSQELFDQAFIASTGAPSIVKDALTFLIYAAEKTGSTSPILEMMRAVAEIDGVDQAELERLDQLERWAAECRVGLASDAAETGPERSTADFHYDRVVGPAATFVALLATVAILAVHAGSIPAFEPGEPDSQESIELGTQTLGESKSGEIWQVGSTWTYRVERSGQSESTDESAALQYYVTYLVSDVEHRADSKYVKLARTGGISEPETIDLSVGTPCILRLSTNENWFCDTAEARTRSLLGEDVAAIEYSGDSMSSQFAPSRGFLKREYVREDHVFTETLVGWELGRKEAGMRADEVVSCDWNQEVVDKNSVTDSSLEALARAKGLSGERKVLRGELSGRSGAKPIAIVDDGDRSLLVLGDSGNPDATYATKLPAALMKIWHDPSGRGDYALLVFADRKTAQVDVLRVDKEGAVLFRHRFRRKVGKKDFYGGFILANRKGCYIQLRNQAESGVTVANLDLASDSLDIEGGSLRPAGTERIDLAASSAPDSARDTVERSLCGGKGGRKAGTYECECPSWTLAPSMGPMRLKEIRKGSFTREGAEEALVEIDGCAPHSHEFAGLALLRKQDDGWRRLSYEPGLKLDRCELVSDPGRPALFVCADQHVGQGSLYGAVQTVDFASGRANTQALFSYRDNEGACPSRGITTIEYDGPEVVDLNGDGDADLKFTFEVTQAPIPDGVDPCDVPDAHLRRHTESYAVDFIWNGTGFSPSAETRAAFAAVQAAAD